VRDLVPRTGGSLGDDAERGTAGAEGRFSGRHRIGKAGCERSVRVTFVELRRRARRLTRVRLLPAVVLLGLAACGGSLARSASPTTLMAPTTTTASSPSGVVSHIEVPSREIVSGGAMTASLVVDNHTGEPIDAGCGPNLAVALGNEKVQPQIGFPAIGCLHPPRIPVGTSRWPLQLSALDYSWCSLPGEPSSPPTRTCGRNGDPLPPGDYRTVFFGTVALLHPDPATVRVLAAHRAAVTTPTGTP